MFHTKKDLDKHVRSSLSRLRDNEKHLRGYTIAKLYFKIGEYKTAEYWVSLYLSANDNCAAAHKLRGQCFEKLKKPEQQLLAYQRSLELDKKQTELLIEVCKLLQMDELSGVTAAKARYWYELAESRNIQDDAVLNLKLKYLNDGAHRTDTWKNVHDILLKEIAQRPLDIGLRIRLVRHYIEQGRISDAFKYAYDIEMKQNAQFRNSIDWYSTVAQLIAKYKAENESHLDKDWTYWLLLICTLDRHVFLALAQTSNDSAQNARNLSECVNLLFELDQALNKWSASTATPNEPDRALATEFTSHFRGQLCLHAASLLFKRELAARARNNWRETTKSALPLLLLAYNFGRVDKLQPWMKNATESARELITLWSTESRFRCGQAGRTLLSCVDSHQPENTALNNLRKMINEELPTWLTCDEVLNEIRRSTTDSDWRRKLHRQLFTSSEHHAFSASSHFVKSKTFERPEYIWPQISDLETDEEISQIIEPSSLARLVYLALGYDAATATASATATSSTASNGGSTNISPEVRCRVFRDLNFSISNLVNCSAETLNQLDIDTFLYATAIQVKRSIEVERSHSTGNDSIANKPRVLPYANMANRLCTEEQANWWTAAYKVYNNTSGDELAELRATLQYGIEAVRGFGGPRMDLIILLKLGQLFYHRAQDTSKTVERGFLEARTEALFKFSLNMLRMQSASRSNSNVPFRRLFKYATANSHYEIETEINSLAEEAITFLADRYFKNKEYEECIEDLAGIRLPFATYFQAESYRKMIELSNTPKKNKRVYVDKARDCLSQTLDLLDAPNVDKNHPLKAIVDEDIKRLHMESRKIETNQSMSDSFVSANGRSDLDDSIVRVQRDINTAISTPVVVPANNERLERMIHEMMESLTLLKDDVAEIRTKVNNIDTFLDNNDTFLSNASMYPMYTNRLNSLNLQQQQRNAAALSVQQAAAAAVALGNSYNMPGLNGMYPPLGLNQTAGLNPYQAAAMANAATISSTRNASMPSMQMHPGSPVQLPYGNTAPLPNTYGQGVSGQFSNPYGSDPAALNYNLGHLPTAYDPRTNLLTMVQQPTSFAAASASAPVLNTTPSSSNALQLELNTSAVIQSPKPFAATLSATTTSTPPPPINFPAAVSTPKQWNAAFNNAPVEKGPPVNVVITSSDPLPAQNTSTNQLSFSVTIPAQHIKNNNTTPVSASKANPTITAVLQQPDNKTLAKADAPEKEVKTPSAADQKSIFGNAAQPTTPFATPTAQATIFGKSTIPFVTSPAPPSIFSGFGASKTQETANETPTKPAEPAKKNVFEGFSFGLSTASKAAEPAKAPFSFSNIGQTASSNAATVAKPAEESSTAAANVSGAGHHDDEEYVPTAHFEPVIALPELIEVKTGEEDEIALFEHRAKLLRYFKESKEWKDRGIGNMKVLASKSDPNKVRLLMRREQVFKVCCNQMLTKDTKFVNLPNTQSALSWYGQDYSENELQVEMLAVRFKTADICQRFHQAILDAQKNMSDGNQMPQSVQPISTTANAPAQQQKGFGKQFKPKAGSWTCEMCYCNNKAVDTTCPACNTPKDKSAVTEKPKTATAPPATQFSFGNLAAATTITASKPTESATQQQKGFGEQFKPKAGSWSCESCYCSNKAADTTCPACNTPKDKNAPNEKPKAPAPVTSNFNFGTLNTVAAAAVVAAATPPPKPPTTNTTFSGFGDQFKPKPGSWSCVKCYTSNKADTDYCVACEAPKDYTVPKKETKNIFETSSGAALNFSFGSLGQSTTVASNAAPTSISGNLAPAPATTVGSKPFSFEFKTAAPSSQPIAIAAPKIGSEEFSFVFKPKSPAKGKSPLKQHTHLTGIGDVDDVSDDENVEEEENQTYFTPVIPLPDKIDVKTGEEDENELYSHRAKLYRFRESEWRERGLGNVRILQHKLSGHLRVVMRREQILKICLNHALTRDIEYKPKDSKSWHFVANDFSEGEMELDQFCLRFKSEEIAQEFKRAIDDALGGITSKQNGVGNSSQAASIPARESLASKLSTEEAKKIADLKLPADFFDYKTKTKCSGCRGCNSDEFVFPEVKDINMVAYDENPIPLTQPNYVPSNNLSKDTVASSSSVANSTFSFNSFHSNPIAANTSPAPDTNTDTSSTPFANFNFNTSSSEPAVVKPSTFSFNTSATNIFGSPTVATDVATTAANFSFSRTSIFGDAVASTTNTTPTTSTPPIFGGITSFSSAPSPITSESTTTTTASATTKPFFGANAFGTNASLSPATNVFSGFGAAKTTAALTESVDEQTKVTANFAHNISNENGQMNASAPLTPVTSKTTSTPATVDTSDNENNRKSTPILFGDSGGLSFASLAQNTATDTPNETANISSPFVSQVSFATLAAAQTNSTGSVNDKTNVSQLFTQGTGNSFIGLTNRDDFSSFSGPRNGPNAPTNTSTHDTHDNENVVDDANYDPHFEPIIELPDEIEISTGEENEQKLFGERAKLYRYDAVNKEWKERGVGEFKILHHAANKSYRLLLRREQIHKCVLNMALSADIQLNPMKQSDKAFCWVATNFAEETETGALESLSVRFRNAPLAQKFHETVQDCLAQLRARSELEPEDD